MKKLMFILMATSLFGDTVVYRNDVLMFKRTKTLSNVRIISIESFRDEPLFKILVSSTLLGDKYVWIPCHKILKLNDSNGSPIIYDCNDFEILKKEPLSKIKWKKKTTTFAIGFGTIRNFSLLSISRDFKIANNYSFFITADIPIVILSRHRNFGDGHAFIGSGFAYQQNYNGDGFNLTYTFNYQMYDGISGQTTYHSSINYQWKFGSHSFLSTGIMSGKYWKKMVTYDDYRLKHYISPTTSYFYRF